MQSIPWQRLTSRGEAAHTGTTPTRAHHDAGLVATHVDALAAVHEVTLERTAKTAVVPLDAGIQVVLASTADDLGLPYARAMSGASHDAQEIAAICPTAMVFVPASTAASATHSARVLQPRRLGDGTDVLANAVLRLADHA